MIGSDTTENAKTGRTAASRNIAVAGLRQILVWPLALATPADETTTTISGAERLARDLAAPGSGWTRVRDLLDHAPPPRTPWIPERSESESAAAHLERARAFADRMEAAQTYGEFVYFYDFLQTTIFRHKPEPKTASDEYETGLDPISLWRHTEVTGIDFDIVSDGHRVSLRADIDRFQIYIFDSGAAIVVIETAFGSGRPVEARALPREFGEDFGPTITRRLTLADVLSINDHLRRAYTPYFHVEDDAKGYAKNGRVGTKAARVPSRIVWLGRDGNPLAVPVCAPDEDKVREFQPASLDRDLEFVRSEYDVHGRRSAPVADHWRHILAPLVFDGYGRPESDAHPRWRHVLDERIPLMSFVSLSGAADALESCRPHTLGVTPSVHWAESQRRDLGLIQRGDWVRLCGADEAGGDPLPYNPGFLADFEKEACYDRFMASPQTTSAARFLIAGYHFAVVGSGHDYFDQTLVHHFRRHYFQMVLLANMELASLLATSSRISRAVDLLERNKPKIGVDPARRRFREELLEIEEDFLTFVHRYRFSGVSNQIQPTELFERLRKAMRLEGLYRDVREELAAAVQFNGGQEQAEVARSSRLLAAVAAIAAPFGLAFTFLGMSLLAEPIGEIITGTMPDDPRKSVVASLLRLLLAATTGLDLSGLPETVRAWMSLSFRLMIVAVVTWAFLWISEHVYRRMSRDIHPERSRRRPKGGQPLTLGDEVVVDRLRDFQTVCIGTAFVAFAATVWLAWSN